MKAKIGWMLIYQNPRSKSKYLKKRPTRNGYKNDLFGFQKITFSSLWNVVPDNEAVVIGNGHHNGQLLIRLLYGSIFY
jgi:hypothetical protein